METKKIRVAIDLEAVNSVPQIVAIGLAVTDIKGKVLKKQDWMIIPEGGMLMEKRRLDEFWVKNPKIYQRVLETNDLVNVDVMNYDEVIKKYAKLFNNVDQNLEEFQIKDFVRVFDGLAKEFGVKDNEIILDSDNPEFDYAGITPLLKRYCNRCPIRYTPNLQYRCIRDYGDAIWNLGIYNMVKNYTSEIQEHNHFPSNDAHHIIVFNILSETVLQCIKFGPLSDEWFLKSLDATLKKAQQESI